MTIVSKKNYNEIEARNNMKVETEEEVNEVSGEKKELKKVVSAQPTKVKKNLVSRLFNGVLGPDGLSNVGSHVNDEIIVPAIKNIVFDAITSGISMVLFRDSNPRGGGYGHGPSRPHTNYGSGSQYRPRTNYTSQYTSQQPAPAQQHEPRQRARYGVDEYLIQDRFDAAQVLNSLVETADMYDTVSVADYYDLIGVASQFTDNNYGWTIDTITRASVVPVRGGYIIKFPQPEVI